MKNIVEVLKQKEAELQQLQVEVEALRVAIRLVSEDPEDSVRISAPAGPSFESRVKETPKVSDATTRQFP
jgi:hypothetical protein